MVTGQGSYSVFSWMKDEMMMWYLNMYMKDSNDHMGGLGAMLSLMTGTEEFQVCHYIICFL